MTKICLICKKAFKNVNVRRRSKYCSHQCFSKAIKQGKYPQIGFRKNHSLSSGKKHPNYQHGFNSRKNVSCFYICWRCILARCNNKNNKAYKHYGGRGIKCEWKTFIEFRDDIYESYKEHLELFGKKNTTIDRIDVDGNYCKSNCRWATLLQQRNNRRTIIHT